MEQGEEPMQCFGRIDKIVQVLASLGVMQSVAGVNRKIIVTIIIDYDMEARTILYCESVTRAEIKSIVRGRRKYLCLVILSISALVMLSRYKMVISYIS